MTNHVEGKSIVITGGGGGFGKLVADKAAALGASVTLGDIDGAAAEAVATAITASGGKAQAVATDVTDLAQCQKLVGAAVDAHGRIDAMINNAGIMPLAFFSDHEAAYPAWQRCIDINIKGVLNGMIAAYDPMIRQGRGQVINISSIYGNFPVTGAAVYGASKAAVNFLSESFRVEARGKVKVHLSKARGRHGPKRCAEGLNLCAHDLRPAEARAEPGAHLYRGALKLPRAGGGSLDHEPAVFRVAIPGAQHAVAALAGVGEGLQLRQLPRPRHFFGCALPSSAHRRTCVSAAATASRYTRAASQSFARSARSFRISVIAASWMFLTMGDCRPSRPAATSLTLIQARPLAP